MIMVLASGCAPLLYPTELYDGFFQLHNGTLLQIPKKFPFNSEWGSCNSNNLPIDEDTGMPERLCAIWLSIVEQCFYITSLDFPVDAMEHVWMRKGEDGESLFSHIVFGMAPYGKYVLWFYGLKKSIVIAIDNADPVDIDMKDFLPENPNMSLQDYCKFHLDNLPLVKSNLEKNNLPTRDLFDNYMKLFNYRYVILFENWNEDDKKWTKYKEEEIQPDYDYIEEKRYDGTHDKLHDGSLLKYHKAGKPKKIALSWHIKKSEYSAYFWFDEDEIRTVFDRFYGMHPDTKTDFIIRIDPEKRKYELALYRYGLKEPQIIPETAYQLLVFKNQFEDYRSNNYKQQRGAWIW